MFLRITEAYRNSTVIVVGTGGIGLEILRLLDGIAGQLIVGDRYAAGLDQAAGVVCRTPLASRVLDVSNSTDVYDFFAWSDSLGPPHFLFFTAGVLNIEPLSETTVESWRRSVDINLNGAVQCSQEAARRMVSNGRGSLLLLGSIAGTKARSGSRVNPVYNTTKAGIAAFVNAAAMQWRPHGVRINCISPGPTETNMMAIQPPGVHSAVRNITLDQRLNDPREVAEVALFVAGHGRFTGEDVPLGGGAGLGG